MPATANPHDRFFKESFSRPAAAAELFERALPAEVVAALDLSRLQPAKGSFVDPQLREHYTDLLFEATCRDGSPALLYLLAEHKSHPHWWVGLDLGRYAIAVWNDWVQRAGKGQRQLPPLIPLVLYHGEEQWTVPTDLGELVAPLPALERYRPRLRYELFDLGEVADETLPSGVVSRAALLAFKYIFRPEIRDRVGEIVASLRDLGREPGGLDYVRTVLNYLIVAARELEAERLRAAVETHFRAEDEIMPTIAEQWVQQGLQQGKREGEGAVVERLLRRRFGPLPPWAAERLTMAKPDELGRWADRLLDAPDLATVFREDGRH